MAETFAITTTTTTVPLDAQRRGSATFTVSNTGGRALRGRTRLVPAGSTAAPWLALDGPVERDFPLAGTQQYTVQIAVPPAAPAGSYPFRLDVVGVDDPDDEFAQGPSVTFTVPAPVTAPRPFPWWIVAVAGALLLIVMVAAVVLVGQNNTNNAAATQTAVVATATAVVANAALFDGAWVLSSGNMTLQHDGITVHGTFNDLLSRVQPQVAVAGTVVDRSLTLQSGAKTTVDPTGKTLSGASPFCGARADALFPDGCSVAGTWFTTIAGNTNCPLTLTRQGISVSGRYCRGALEATISFQFQLHQLIISGSDSGGQGHFTIFIADGATQFRTVRQGLNGLQEAWCGARTAGQVPTPCT